MGSLWFLNCVLSRVQRKRPRRKRRLQIRYVLSFTIQRFVCFNAFSLAGGGERGRGGGT